MDDWVITQHLNTYLPLQLQKILTETSIFIATKHEKTNMTITQIRIIISFILNFLPELWKIKIGTMINFHRLWILLYLKLKN